MNAIEGAVRTIKHRIESGAWHRGERLPSLAEMAELCNVSRTTMWHALGRLKGAKLLHARRGGAIVAGPDGCSIANPAPAGLLWNRTKQTIAREVLSGTFAGQSHLPVTKLAEVHGVTYRTMKKSLEALVNEHLLIRKGRRFAPNNRRTGSRRRRIVMISEGESGHGIILGEPRSIAALEGFERDCAEMAFDGVSEWFTPRNADCLIEARTTLARMGMVDGFVVNVWNPWNETLLRRWLDLFAYLLNTRATVVVLDQGGDFPFPERFLATPRFKALRIAGESAGEGVGRSLLDHGHQRLAYVSPDFSTDWAQARYRGLCRFWKRHAPGRGAVELFALDAQTDPHDFELALLNLSESDARSLYASRFSDEQAASWAAKIPAIRTWALTRHLSRSRFAKTIRPVANALATIPDRDRDARAYARLQDSVLFVSGDSALGEYLNPLVARALDQGHADCWVCADQKTARVAVSFLRSRGKRVPADIAVIGFDNFRETHEQQVSIYDFNVHGMVQEALLMIMDEKTLFGRPAISEVAGYVVERRTTRR